MAGHSRVLVPINVRKIVQDIKKTFQGRYSDVYIHAMLKECEMDPNEAAQRLMLIGDVREIAGEHSDEDIHIMLKDCNMDPNEAAQRLVYIEDVRKMIQDIKNASGRHNNSYIYSMLKECNMDANEAAQRFKMIGYIREITGKHSDDDILTVLKDCNMDANEAAQMLSYMDTFHEVKRKRDRKKVNASNGAYEEYRWTRGNQWRGARGGRGRYYSSNVSDDAAGARIVSSVKENGVSNHTEKGFRLTTAENNIKAHVTRSFSTNFANGMTNPSTESSNHGLPLQPSEAAGLPLDRSKTITDPAVANTSCAAAEIVVLDDRTGQGKSLVAEKSQLPESSQLPLFPTPDGSQAVSSNQDSQPPQLNGVSTVIASESASTGLSNSQSVSEKSTPNLETMMEKLNLSSRQPVIFPDHLYVPDTLKGRLTFGSLEATPNDEDSVAVAESIQGNSEAFIESSLGQNVASIAREVELSVHPLSLQRVSEDVLPSEDKSSVDSALKDGQSNQELPLGGFQNSLLQTTQDYNFSLMPHVLGPHFVQLEVPEIQSGNSPASSTSGPPQSATQPTGVGQSSMALSPPLFPYFRHPYAPNYIPYNPYFPHVYLPQNAHHLLSHNGFPPQPSTGNVYVPSAAPAVAPGVKFPVPSVYKHGTNAGSLTHFGIPAAYGTYGSTSVGYGASVTPGSSSVSEDLTASQTKEKDSYSSIQQLQGEDSHLWAPAPGRDIPSLQPNYFYNLSLPQAQHMALSPAQVGLYHPSQTVPAQSNVQPLLHQSLSNGGSVESVIPQPSSYQQPRASKINWNTSTLLSRENL